MGKSKSFDSFLENATAQHFQENYFQSFGRKFRKLLWSLTAYIYAKQPRKPSRNLS